jgi:hypothetical protein
MSFLDNSGDIILDAVITDAGRKRMAEGKFSITKYAFGDEEINYALFNDAHPSGSAFYDLQIMQTPIFEAFTNNTSTMSSKLMTLYDNNYLYLPVLRLNETWGLPMPEQCSGENECKSWSSRVIRKAYLLNDNETDFADNDANTPGIQHADDVGFAANEDNAVDHEGMFVVTCDNSTEDLWKERNAGAAGDNVRKFTENTKHYSEGVIFGATENEKMDNSFICVDQGIEGAQTGLSVLTPFPSELRETAYLIRIDHRLGRVAVAPSAVTKIDRADGNNNTTAVTHRRYGEEGAGGIQREANNAIDRREVLPYSFVDDDHMATYYITTGRPDIMQTNILNSYRDASLPDSQYFPAKTLGGTVGTEGLDVKRWLARQAFQEGPVGSRIQFTIRAQDTVKLSNDLFDTSKTKKLYRDSPLNGTKQGPAGDGPDEEIVWVVGSNTGGATPVNYVDVYYIDSTITVTGVTTGYSLNIPVRFVKRVL